MASARMRLEVGQPVAQRERIVLAQRLDVADLEAGFLHRRHDVGHRMQLTVREDVAGQEGVGRRGLGVQAGDAVVEEQPAGTQQRVHGARIGVELLAADVLVHADAGDLVERAVGDLAVVADADLDAVGEAGGLDPLACELGLGLRERDADAVHAVVLGGVDQQRAPAAADVEQALALGQSELAADELELAFLGGFERLVEVVEVGARVDEARAEQHRVEAVGDVVVMADRGRSRPSECRRPGRCASIAGVGGRQQDARSGDPHRGENEPRALAGAQAQDAELAAQAQHGLEVGVVVDGERAGHPRAREPDLARSVQEVGDRAPVTNLDDGRVFAGR